MNISSKCSPQTSYVALSRTRSRAGLRIMRSFPITAFQGTSPTGPALLLATRQRDVARTERLMEAYRSSQRNVRQKRIRNCHLQCRVCKELVPALTYSQRQLDQGADRRCPRCAARNEEQQVEYARAMHDERICAGKKVVERPYQEKPFPRRN